MVSENAAQVPLSLVERVGRNARNHGSKPTTIFVGFMVSVHL